MSDEPCTVGDLRMNIEAIATYRTGIDGFATTWVWEEPDSYGGVTSYHCLNCPGVFEPEEVGSPSDTEDAWQKALAHLPTARASDGRLVRVEIAA